MDASYITSAQKAQQLPEFDAPEFAFFGRSNSGKSSLLNALAKRKNLARKSATPGRTQMVNFFRLEREKGRSVILADLPGYGFNVARQDIQKLWSELLVHYVERERIHGYIYLIDARRRFDDYELSYMKDLCAKRPVLLVPTKIDKCSAREREAARKALVAQVKEAGVPVHGCYPVSMLKGTGIDKLRDELFALAVPKAVPTAPAEGPGEAP